MTTTDYSKPIASVIVPVFNRRKLALRSVRSLLDQDFELPYEIVVVDDGSTDGVGDLLATLDAKVCVYRQKNQGAAAARLTGVKHARAPIVLFHDSDDFATRKKVSSLTNALQSNPECVFSYGKVQDVDGNVVRDDQWIDGILEDETGVIEDPFRKLFRDNVLAVNAMAFATYREIALQCGEGRSFYKVSEDNDMQLRIALCGKFAFVATITTICFLRRDDGLSNSHGRVRANAYKLHSTEDIFRHLRSPDAEICEVMRERVETMWPFVMAGLLMMGDFEFARKMFSIGPRQGRWWKLLGRIPSAVRGATNVEPQRYPAWVVAAVKAACSMRDRFRKTNDGT